MCDKYLKVTVYFKQKLKYYQAKFMILQLQNLESTLSIDLMHMKIDIWTLHFVTINNHIL